MNRIVDQLKKSFEVAKNKGWNQIFIGIDLHDTVLYPTYSDTLSDKFFPFAKETLQLMSEDKGIYLILWSCSTKENNKLYYDFFKQHNIHFDAINKNEIIKSTSYADFESKLYFNLILDDKAGFLPSDWQKLYYYLKIKK